MFLKTVSLLVNINDFHVFHLFMCSFLTDGSVDNHLKEKKSLSLTEVEISRLVAVVKILKETSRYHSSTFADVDIALMLKLLKSWPLAMIFPG